MTIESFIARLAALGVRITSEGEEGLRVSAPRGALTPELRDELARRKSELLAALSASGAGPVRRRDRNGAAPLSLAQERLWVFERLEPASTAYQMAVLLRVEGPLDREALDRSLEEIVRRHEPLRTTFRSDADGPVQVVSPPEPVRVAEVDLTGLGPSEADAEERRTIAERQDEPFDLGEDPLLRATLIRRSAESHGLLLETHHIVADGVSLVVMVRELAELYSGFTGGASPSLPDLPVRFSDYALWEREWLESGATEELERYWRETLDGDLPVLDLPRDRPRRPVQTYRGGSSTARIDPETTRRLDALAREGSATLSTLLLAAFKAVLFRHTGQEDLIVGAAVHGRNRAEVGDLVGMFVNTVAVRSDLSGDPTFRELLRRVQGSLSGALAHGELPFEKVVELVNPPRDRSRTPIIQVLFNSFGADVPAVTRAADGVRFRIPSAAELMSRFGVASKYDVTLYSQRGDDGVELVLVHNADLFDDDRMERLLAHCIRLLARVADDPDLGVGEVDLLTRSERAEVERRRVPVRGAAGRSVEAAEDRAGHLVARFREVAARFPERTAVAGHRGRRTYAELDQVSDGLAALLADPECGVGPRVGVLCDPEPTLCASVLGILKAGRSFVPLDPVNPPERLARMMAEADLATILADRANADLVERLGAPDVCFVDSVGAPTTVPVPEPAPPGAEAYVLFTSGSTGTPKGVVQSCRNLLEHAETYADSIGIDEDDRVSLVSSYGFDAALLDIFGALLRGAALVPAHLRQQGIHRLRRRLREGEITVYHSTPTVFRALLDEGEEEPYASVRAVVLGGEPVRADDVDAFRARFAEGTVLVNLYGASESSTAVQYHVDHGTKLARGAVPIGWPVRGSDVVLLDGDGRATPVVGEIAIESSRIALGYLSGPDGGEGSFVELPEGSGRRLYRTGDLARRRPDGALVHLGRKDHQVKLRGYRIELGEIEACLEGHRRVSGAAARLDEVDGEKHLVAFVTGPEPDRIDEEALRLHLLDRLPSYMVPTRTVVLPELPKTSTGKIDRRGLPEVSLETGSERADTLPRDAIEESLASIWRDVLGRPGIGVRQDFFELGGSSLQATQIVARVDRLLGRDVSLRDFFADPTIAGLGERLRNRGAGASRRGGPTPVPRDRVLPTSFAQEGMWLLQQLDRETTAYTVAAAAWIEGELDPEAMERAWSSVVARHEILRTRIRTSDGVPYQSIDGPDAFGVERIDLSDLPPSEAEEEGLRLASERASRPFELAEELPLRVLLFRVADRRWLHALIIHHAAADLWSVALIGREVAAHYGAYRVGGVPDVPELPIQYADFAVWQRRSLTGERLAADVDYWRARLDGLQRLSLPTDRPRNALQSTSGSRIRVELPSGLIEGLRTAANRMNATPFMVSLAAFNVLLARYSGTTDVAVGAPIANRTVLEIEALAGTFVNTLVHRNDLSGDPTSTELVRRVREVALEAYEHQELPFEKLVTELRPEPDVTRSPLVDVLFTLGDLPVQPVRMEGLDQVPEFLDNAGAQFDLGVWLRMEEPAGLTVTYRNELFDRATAERIASHYRSLLDEMVRRPDARLSELEMLGAEERETLLEAWNRTEKAYPRESTFADLFRERARRHPERPALTWGSDGRLTYGELDARSDAVAAELAARGVGVGDRVAVLVGRGPVMVACLLGVLKSGAAYVPLDPAYPEGRVRFILEDSEAAVVLTEAACEPLVSGSEADVVCFPSHDAFPPEDAGPPTGAARAAGADGADARGGEIAAASPAGPEDPAYVIYTSGSTGRPKGVVVPNRALVNFLHGMTDEPGLGREDVLAAVTTVSFDIAGLELYLPLLVGARVALLDEEESADPYRLADRLDEVGATVMQATPATWRMLVDAGWEGDPDLRALCGGEALPPELRRSLLPRVAELWNMYGPTETTIWSTVERMDGSDEPVTVGRPIANTRIYILDPVGRPAPVGVTGEIYIAGDGVAAGYHRREELTREKFVPDPFGGGRGGTMFRTGDLGRFRADGRIEHLGRVDNQVKVRGFRIELGEIESLLASHPAVSEAVVAAHGDRLVAYIVFESGRDLTVTEVRTYLRRDLPPYMIPAVVVPMTSLPLTPNGKLDRRSLPDPYDTGLVSSRQYVEPGTDAGRLVAEIWSDLLGVERVGAHDNFFDLGGHSLLAVRAVARLEERTGQRLDPRRMFFQTLEQIAEAIGVPESLSA